MAQNIDLGPHLEVRWKQATLGVRREIMAELHGIYRLLEDEGDIPVLAAAPVEHPVSPRQPAGRQQAQASLFDAPAAPARERPDLTPRPDNPFLPKSVLARLQDSQAQASAQLRELMHSQGNLPAPDVQRMEQELRLRLGPVIEALIEEHMQGLKAELRFRLRAEMDRLIAASTRKDG